MKKLFQQFKWGSDKAFTIYYRRYNRRVFASLKNLCNDDALAEELTQQVFVDLWENRAMLNDEKHLENRLFHMAKCLLFEHLREEEKASMACKEMGQMMEAAEASLRAALVRENVFAAVEEEMKKLPPQRKMVMQMIFLDGLDTHTVAERLHLAFQTVLNHKSQAIMALVKELSRRDLFLIFFLIALLYCFYGR